MLCSLFENPVTVHEDNQGDIALPVAIQMRPRTKHIAIKYHHLRSFVLNGDVEIQHVDNQRTDCEYFYKYARF